MRFRRNLFKVLKMMVGPCGLEPQTSTVVKSHVSCTLNDLQNDRDRLNTCKPKFQRYAERYGFFRRLARKASHRDETPALASLVGLTKVVAIVGYGETAVFGRRNLDPETLVRLTLLKVCDHRFRSVVS